MIIIVTHKICSLPEPVKEETNYVYANDEDCIYNNTKRTISPENSTNVI